MDKKEQWESECQPFELDFQSNDNYRWDATGFHAAWTTHFEQWCGMCSYHYPDRVMLDLGCGSRPAIDFFQSSVRYYLDPLLAEFTKIPQVEDVWDLYHINHALNVPAEKYVHMLHKSCMFINCWNCLDHCYDWEQVIANVIGYARAGCMLAIATDTVPHKGHIGIDDPAKLYKMLSKEFIVVKEENGYWGRDYAWLMQKK